MSSFFNNGPNKDFKNKRQDSSKNKKEVKNLNDLLNSPTTGAPFKQPKKISMKRSSFLIFSLCLIALASCVGVFGGELLERYIVPKYVGSSWLRKEQTTATPREVHIEGDFCSSGEAVSLKVFPSVVSIKTTIRDEALGNIGDFSFYGGFPFMLFPFFDQDSLKDKKSDSDDRDVIAHGFGSGIIFAHKDDAAYVMTNFHVIKHFLKHSEKSEIDVYFDGDIKNSKKGEVVGYKPSLDVAVIKVPLNDKNRKIVCADIGNSDKLNKGQEIFVLGTPIGLDYSGSISHGIVSGLDREIQFEGVVDPVRTIQVDAAMNAGNSGGAVCDKNGRIIGMCVAKVARRAGGADMSDIADSVVQGMGICLPINAVMNEVNKIMQNQGKNNRRPLAQLGIMMFSEEMEKYFQKYYKTEGCIVYKVEPGSAAAKAKIRSSDVIIKFDGEDVKNSRALNEKMLQKHVGDEAEITYKNIRTKAVKTVRIRFEMDGDRSFNVNNNQNGGFDEFRGDGFRRRDDMF